LDEVRDFYCRAAAAFNALEEQAAPLASAGGTPEKGVDLFE
jgi:hypothetical protein